VGWPRRAWSDRDFLTTGADTDVTIYAYVSTEISDVNQAVVIGDERVAVDSCDGPDRWGHFWDTVVLGTLAFPAGGS